MESNGKLEKLTIRAFTDTTFQEEIKELKYTAFVNPEKYSLSKKIEYFHQNAIGTSGDNPKFAKIISPELSIPFLFDRTGVIPETRAEGTLFNSVKEEIERFEQVVYNYSGQEHKPRHVQIGWGSLIFQAILSELSYEYKLFDKTGAPLRAVATAKFTYAVDDNKRAAKENQSSPDLTHVRQVIEGDTLPLMCKKIYGDPKYYLEVARFNNLTNFRKLQPGQRINFPPLEKTTK